MKTRNRKTSVLIVLTISVVLSVCGGCSSDSDGESRQLKLHPIYESMLWGALIGVIAGDRSGQEREGAAIGAGIGGLGALLIQTDKMPPKPREPKHEPEDQQELVVQIHNENGSLTPVVLKRDGGEYIGPNGEYYKRLPTEEQLKPVYGL